MPKRTGGGESPVHNHCRISPYGSIPSGIDSSGPNRAMPAVDSAGRPRYHGQRAGADVFIAPMRVVPRSYASSRPVCVCSRAFFVWSSDYSGNWSWTNFI